MSEEGTPVFDNDMLQAQLDKLRLQDFGWALRMLREGKSVCRKGWNGKDMCVFLIKGRTVEYNTFQSWKNNANKVYDPPYDIQIADHIDMKAAHGLYVTGWVASQTDILATDWEIYRD
jgi:hypothetical protein